MIFSLGKTKALGSGITFVKASLVLMSPGNGQLNVDLPRFPWLIVLGSEPSLLAPSSVSKPHLDLAERVSFGDILHKLGTFLSERLLMLGILDPGNCYVQYVMVLDGLTGEAACPHNGIQKSNQSFPAVRVTSVKVDDPDRGPLWLDRALHGDKVRVYSVYHLGPRVGCQFRWSAKIILEWSIQKNRGYL